jgi:hypothetical protein
MGRGRSHENGNRKVVFGYGEMSAVEIVHLGVNSAFNMHIEGYDDYFENDLWSFDKASGKMHLFSVTSEGEAHDHVGDWIDDKTLEFSWKGYYGNEDLEEKTTVTWISKDQVEVKETDYSRGKLKLSANYVLKRKEASEQAVQEAP